MVQVVQVHRTQHVMKPGREALVDIGVHHVAVEDRPHPEEHDDLGGRAEQNQRQRLDRRVDHFLAKVHARGFHDVHMGRVVVNDMEIPQAIKRMEATVHHIIHEAADQQRQRKLCREEPVRRPQLALISLISPRLKLTFYSMVLRFLSHHQ